MGFQRTIRGRRRVYLPLSLAILFLSWQCSAKKDNKKKKENDNLRGLCLLCSNGVAGLKRPHFFVDAYGKTCTAKSLEMATDLRANSNQCSAEVGRYRETCCGNADPTPIPQVVTNTGTPEILHTGPHPICKICSDGSIPDTPSMVINILNLGPGSCRQYYNWGLAGNIEAYMCPPLQYYSRGPCGCGKVWPTNPTTPSNNVPAPGGGDGGGSGSAGTGGGGGGGGGGAVPAPAPAPAPAPQNNVHHVPWYCDILFFLC